MVKQTLTRWLVLCLLAAAQYAQSQCNPSAPEVPGNGFDEDCDGLDDLYLALPPFLYATEGQDVEIYFRNLILSKHPQDYVFSVNTPLGGTSNAQKWQYMPGNDAAGEYPLTVTVRSAGGQTLAAATTTLRVSPNEAPADMSARKLVLFGHSFFDQGYMPKYIWDLTHQPGNPPISFHGKKVSWANANARHEGYGGMMARWFFNDPGSPVRYGSKINFRQYFNDVIGWNQRPDWVVFHLDINDFCGYSALSGATLQEIDDSITNDWNRHATRLIDSMRVAAPGAKIAVCISPPPNARESSFSLTYGGNPILNNRWRWQKIISRLIFNNIQRYGGREAEGIYLIPEHLDLDDLGEYNPPDARHPDPPDNNINTHCGYNEIAKQIYAWLRWVQHHPVPGGAPIITSYRDADNDGFGHAGLTTSATSIPGGYVAVPGDCDDSNPNRYPGAPENCNNNLDDDCDALTDEDSQAPVAQCKTSVSLPLDASGQALLSPAQVNNGCNDDCDDDLALALSRSQFSCAEMGQNFVKLRVRDDAGNESECQTVVSVLDQTPPLARCRQPFALPLNADGRASLAPADLDDNSQDACSGLLTRSLDRQQFDCNDLGSQSLTLTVLDASGNTSTCVSTVLIQDLTAPAPLCKAAFDLVLDANGQAQVTIAQVDNGSWDACGSLNLSLSQSQFDCDALGPQTLTLTVRDGSGNANICQTQVFVKDGLAPTPICKPALDLALDANGQAQLAPELVDNGSWDGCGVVGFSLEQEHFDCADLGENLLALTVRDASGNEQICQTIVRVRDQTPPQVICKSLITIELDENGMAALLPEQLDAGSSDACGGALVFAASLGGFSCMELGEHTVTLWVQDARNNVGQCTATVHVTDKIAPEITCQDLTISLDANGQAVVYMGDMFAGGRDNCGAVTLLSPVEMFAFSCADAGESHAIELQAIDASSNFGFCTAQITVLDSADADGDGTANCADQCPENAETAVFLAFFADADADGFGTGEPILACQVPPGTSSNADDCDDSNAAVFPGASEILNGLDDDCDTDIDEGLVQTTLPGADAVPVLRLFPNPVSGVLQVEWSGPNRPVQAWLQDAAGRFLQIFGHSDFSPERLDFDASALPPGSYFLKIEFEDGARAARVFQKM